MVASTELFFLLQANGKKWSGCYYKGDENAGRMISKQRGTERERENEMRKAGNNNNAALLFITKLSNIFSLDERA